MLSTVASIQDNQNTEALTHDKLEIISYNRKIMKNSILSCITRYTIVTVCFVVTVFVHSIWYIWLVLSYKTDMNYCSFLFTSFAKQCRNPNNNTLKSKQNLCRLRRVCLLCYGMTAVLGKHRESILVGSTKCSILSAWYTLSKIT